MDIKNVNNIQSIDLIRSRQSEIKSDNTQEREANGQSLYQRQKQKKKMTPEQFKEALAKLNAKDFMKEMNWVAHASVKADVQYAEVKDAKGVIIRTISEFDLWELITDTNADIQNKGHLLNKVA